MFDYLRIQFIQPCRAKCAWCSTHRKNPIFQSLKEDGSADKFHQTYLEVIEEYRPKELFVSGGEPLLHEGIADFLAAADAYVQTIHVFTSYQFSRKVMDRIVRYRLPDSVVLNHTPIYFEPARWHRLTDGFPFEVYIDNIRRVVDLPTRKRFKFILNHSLFQDEIRRFSDYVRPNDSCEISLKLMNDQGGGLVQEHMRNSATNVHSRLGDLDGLLESAGWTHKKRPRGSADLMRPMIESGDIEKCPYRTKPIELRLSYSGGKNGRPILKYRYCPYFPPNAGHRFHLGRDAMSKMGKNYHKGDFREYCSDCRLLNYQPKQSSEQRREGSLPVLN